MEQKDCTSSPGLLEYFYYVGWVTFRIEWVTLPDFCQLAAMSMRTGSAPKVSPICAC